MISVDHQLFAQAQAGDAQALDTLLRQVKPDIHRYARSHCHRSSVVEDVVQEALIIVYRRVGEVRSAPALAAWMFRVVTRLCMLPALGLMRGVEAWRDLEDSPRFARLPQDDLRMDLARALESLPEGHRQAVLLRDVEQLTLAEMAGRLGLTVEATKSRLHRARALVREYLQPTAADGGRSA
ncbi:MAG: sigma-70 family RNA polymerase sigma factor [Curvibacter sp.]|nr:sigma-70 family RNA polymerase sigma factor [Curvibacter sp.]